MAKRLLLIDNYDSFTYNIYHLAAQIARFVTVIKNDEIRFTDLISRKFTHIIIGPGPKGPADSGISLEAIAYYQDKLPVLGICLGMQAIAFLSGGTIEPRAPMHGKKEKIHHMNIGIHSGIPSPFSAARYNSLMVTSVDEKVLEVTARNRDKAIMGLRHREWKYLEGVQYHPDSFLSQHGHQLVGNFLDMRYD